MINDNRLASALKTAAKTRLLYREDGGVVDMIAPDWALSTTMDVMRKEMRKSLSQLVEMLGEIPHGCRIEITKAKDSYAVQDVIESVFEEELDFRHTQELPCVCKVTALQFRGYRLMQTHGGRIVGVEEELLSLRHASNIEPTTSANGTSMRWDGDGCTLTVNARRPDEATEGERTCKLWQALERVTWCEWEQPEAAAEDENQMKIGEEYTE